MHITICFQREMIERHGYPYEEHQIITEDGYILTMHHIPYGQYGPSDKRYPILIQHGLESSSAEWVVTGPKNAIGKNVMNKSSFKVYL